MARKVLTPLSASLGSRPSPVTRPRLAITPSVATSHAPLLHLSRSPSIHPVNQPHPALILA